MLICQKKKTKKKKKRKSRLHSPIYNKNYVHFLNPFFALLSIVFLNMQTVRISTGLLRNLDNLENLEKSGNLIFEQKVRDFKHFIQNSGKIWEFENFNAGSNFHANFKI